MASNNLEFKQSISKFGRSNSAPINTYTKVLDRVLGVKWNPIDDCHLLQPINFQDTPKKFTQSTLLKYVSSIFDPLGMSSPIWRDNQHWDRPIANEDYPDLNCFSKMQGTFRQFTSSDMISKIPKNQLIKHYMFLTIFLERNVQGCISSYSVLRQLREFQFHSRKGSSSTNQKIYDPQSRTIGSNGWG